MTQEKLSRRDFFARHIQIILGAVGFSAIVSSCDKEKKPVGPDPTGATFTIDLNDPTYAALTVVGGAMKLDAPDLDFQILVIRTGTDSVSALSAICTNEGCLVNLPNEGKITCPCCPSQFNLSGEVLQGPATEPLQQIDARIENNQILLDY
jgi:cytochrome b6-f complex iron-sulfur subunit